MPELVEKGQRVEDEYLVLWFLDLCEDELEPVTEGEELGEAACIGVGDCGDLLVLGVEYGVVEWGCASEYSWADVGCLTAFGCDLHDFFLFVIENEKVVRRAPAAALFFYCA